MLASTRLAATLLSIDVKHAHGSVERQATYTAVQAELPDLLPCVAPWLGTSGRQRCTLAGQTVYDSCARRGLDQGDPLSNLLYPIVMARPTAALLHELRATDPRAHIFAYQDDVYILAETPSPSRVLERFASLIAPLGLTVNGSKPSAYFGPSSPAAARADWPGPVDPRPVVLKQTFLLDHGLPAQPLPSSADLTMLDGGLSAPSSAG